jgi:hypothetical protein
MCTSQDFKLGNSANRSTFCHSWFQSLFTIFTKISPNLCNPFLRVVRANELLPELTRNKVCYFFILLRTAPLVLESRVIEMSTRAVYYGLPTGQEGHATSYLV